ncbi:hypothetical protein L218DRAFT_408615 [Marasmius fiardii PR-910]|nr:hypothetical protein L218DRAFT_408615 [Marasmius fiardii PR-910]
MFFSISFQRFTHLVSAQDSLRLLEYGTEGPLALADIQLMQTNMNQELPHVACVCCIITKHDQDCEPLDPSSVPEGIAQSKFVRCNKQNQCCSFSEEADTANDKLLKLLVAISSHPKVVKMLGAEAVKLGKLYVQSLHMVAHSQQMARLACDAFSEKLTQFVQSGHNPKSVLSALDNGDSKLSPADEKMLVDFFQWPILPSSGTSGDKAASEDGEDNDDDEDADRSIDEEAKAPPAVQKSQNQRPKTLRPQLPLPLEPELALANVVVNLSLLLLPIFPVAASALSRKKSRLVPLPRGPKLLPRRSRVNSSARRILYYNILD